MEGVKEYTKEELQEYSKEELIDGLIDAIGIIEELEGENKELKENISSYERLVDAYKTHEELCKKNRSLYEEQVAILKNMINAYKTHKELCKKNRSLYEEQVAILNNMIKTLKKM